MALVNSLSGRTRDGNMELSFSWNESRGELSPHCASNAVNVDGICLLSSLLLDDGGCGHAHSLDWLDEGLKRVDSVSSGESRYLDWSRESWGAKLTSDVVTIYSLHDEACFQEFSLLQFRTALAAWRSFLQRTPSLESTEQVEI